MKGTTKGLKLGTLEKTVRILDLYSESSESFTFSEIVSLTGLEKGSVQRILFTLQSLGLLKRHERYKRYSLSPRIISFAVAFCQTDPLLAQAAKHLEPLARKVSEAVSVAILDGVHIFFLNRIPNLVSHDFALLPVRRYAFCTAAGRSIMSKLSRAEVDHILERSPMRRLTARTIIDPDEIRRAIDAARESGIAVQDGEVLEDEIGLAAPILGEGDFPVGAVSLSVDKSQYSLEQACERFSALVQTAAQNMSNSSLSASRLNLTQT